MKLNRTSMLYGTLVLTGTGIVSQLMGFFYRVALSRLIGAENMGLYQLLMPIYSCALSIVSVGLSVAMSRLSAEHRALGNERAISQSLKQCMIYLFGLFGIVAVGTVLLYDPISVFFLGDARTQMGLLVLLPCILLTGVENIHKHYFYGTGQVRPPAATELVEQLVRITAVLTLLMLFLPQNNEVTVALIVVGMVICEIVSSCTLVILYRRNRRGEESRIGKPLPKDQVRRSVRKIALPVGATSLLGNLMTAVIAVIIPQRLVAAGWQVNEAMSAFGVLFGMAIPMLMLPSAFIGALCTNIVPKLAQSAALGRKGEINKRMGKAILSTSMIVMPFLALMLVVGPTLGEFLFLDAAVGTYLPILSLGVLFSCYESIFASALNGLGRQQTVAFHTFIRDLILLAFTYIGTAMPGVGMYGYLAGFCLTSIMGALTNYIYLAKETGLRTRLVRWMILPGIAALLMGLCVHLLFGVLVGSGLNSMVSVLVVAIFGVAIYLFALWTEGIEVFGFRL